jgi:hypothetical protein
MVWLLLSLGLGNISRPGLLIVVLHKPIHGILKSCIYEIKSVNSGRTLCLSSDVTLIERRKMKVYTRFFE